MRRTGFIIALICLLGGIAIALLSLLSPRAVSVIPTFQLPKELVKKIESVPIIGDVLGSWWGRSNFVPRIIISGTKEGYSAGGVVPISSADEPSILIEGNDISGIADVSVYEANEDALFDYLTHDKEWKQTKRNFDVSKFTFLTTIQHNILPRGNEDSRLLLPIGETGIWFIRVKLGSVSQDGFVIRSNTAVLVKEGDNELIFWAQDYKTKRSISGGQLSLYSLRDEKKELGNASFNSEGIARFPIDSDIDVALATFGNDKALIPINLLYLNSGNYTQFQRKSVFSKYFVFTDRPIYRPGDTVYYKAVIRNDDDARYTVPQGIVAVKVYKDWDEKQAFYDKSIVISGDGAVAGQVEIPKDSDTGYYNLSIKIPNQIDSQAWNQDGGWAQNSIGFQVENFRKPEYSIDIAVPKTEYIAGESIPITFSGSYFSGHALSGASVSYTVTAADYYDYEYVMDKQYSAVSDEYRFGGWYGEKVKNDSVVLDTRGTGTVPLSVGSAVTKSRMKVISVEAQYNDGSGNPSFARKNILVYPGLFGIYRKEYGGWSVKTGTEARLPLSLISYGNPEDISSVSLTAKVHRENWVSYQEAGKKYPSYRQEAEELPQLTTTSDSEGFAQFQFIAQKSGSYKITVLGKDAKGNSIEKDFYIWVTSEQYPYYSSQSSGVSVQMDKGKYDPGEIATATIFSDIPDRDIFLSFDRARTNRYQVVRMNGKSSVVQIPIVQTDIPNIFVSISSFSPQNLDEKSVDIKVNTESKQLVMKLMQNRETYGPGDTVVVNVETSDVRGNPVSADTAVWAIDKALFELVDEKPESIFNRFWSNRYYNTQSSHSLVGINVYGAEGGGGGGGGGARSIFKDTAYWNPSVHTGVDGRAQISFKLPDNLTTWVISAIGATFDTRVGQVKKDIIVTKDVIVRPIIPNILRVGDKLRLSSLIHNHTNVDRKFDMSLVFDSGKVTESIKKNISVTKNNLQQLYWSVLPDKANDTAKITISAKGADGNKVGDSIVSILPVLKFGFFDTQAFTGDGAKEFPISLQKDSDLTKTSVSVSLAPSQLGLLPQAMQYLVGYPYGCVEQTTSSFVPTVIARSNLDLLGDVLKDRNLDDILTKGLKRLALLQRADGGWTWWYTGNSDAYITSYVVEYILLAQKTGIPVESYLLERAKTFLEQETQFDPVTNPASDLASRDDRIVKTYILSLLGSAKGKNQLAYFTERSVLIDPDILSMAIMANVRNGNKDPQSNGLSLLMAMMKSQGDSVYWTAGRNTHFGSIDASTAYAIRAILVAGGDRTIAAKAARYLVKNRKNQYWSNTYATAQVVRSMMEFVRNGNEATPNYDYSVTLDGNVVASGTVTSLKQTIPDVVVPVAKMKAEGSIVSVTKAGDGQLYSTVVQKEFRTDPTAKESSKGLVIVREYENDKGSEYTIGVGDTVRVKLTVSGLQAEQNYALIEDELPAGLIPINAKLKNEQFGENNSRYYTSYDASEMEVTPNGMQISIYRLGVAAYTYVYKARAIADGEFQAPPVSVALMYSPEVYGRSSSNVLKISPTSEIIPGKMFQKTVEKQIKSFRVDYQSLAYFLIGVSVTSLLLYFFRDKLSFRRKHISQDHEKNPPESTPTP